MMNIKQMSATAVLSFLLSIGAQAQVGNTQAPSNQQSSQSQYTDSEIQQFVKVAKVIQPMQMEFRQAMMGLIQKSELEMQDFQQMSQLESTGGDTTQFTTAQWSTYQDLRDEMMNGNTEVEQKIKVKVEEQGMTMEEFQKMAQAIQANPQLAQKVRSMMQPQGPSK